MGRPNDDTLIYLNQVVGQGRAVQPGGSSVEGVLAQVETQRGGAIVATGWISTWGCSGWC